MAPSSDGGVYLFRTAQSVIVGIDIAGATWRGPVLAAAAARVPRQPGQPDMEFSVNGSVGKDLAVTAGYRGVTVAGLARKQFRVQLGMMTLVLGLIAFGVFYTLRGIQNEARFLAQMSHEMKTPLATIHLYAETLEMGRVASFEKRNIYLRRIREEAERLGAMVGDMISAGRKRYRMAPEDAETIAEEALQSFEHAYLQFDAADLPPVRCDREAVSRALRNLLSNAVKYGANSRVELRVGRANGHVLFSVADHGIGIPKDQQRRIFERFYRIDQSIPGTGLGLAIAREIVAAHRGEIRVDSAPGQGSTFTIALPVAQEAACQPS